jgi:hypothetical protein
MQRIVIGMFKLRIRQFEVCGAALGQQGNEREAVRGFAV